MNNSESFSLCAPIGVSWWKCKIHGKACALQLKSYNIMEGKLTQNALNLGFGCSSNCTFRSKTQKKKKKNFFISTFPIITGSSRVNEDREILIAEFVKSRVQIKLQFCKKLINEQSIKRIGRPEPPINTNLMDKHNLIFMRYCYYRLLP